MFWRQRIDIFIDFFFFSSAWHIINGVKSFSHNTQSNQVKAVSQK